jgi:hypothetical protein
VVADKWGAGADGGCGAPVAEKMALAPPVNHLVDRFFLRLGKAGRGIVVSGLLLVGSWWPAGGQLVASWWPAGG